MKKLFVMMLLGGAGMLQAAQVGQKTKAPVISKETQEKFKTVKNTTAVVLKAAPSVYDVIKSIPGISGTDVSNKIEQYVIMPGATLGKVLDDLDRMYTEFETSGKNMKSFNTIVNCMKLTEAQRRSPQGQKVCGPVGCSGDLLSCMQAGIMNMQDPLVVLVNNVFGDKNNTNLKGLLPALLEIVQQQKVMGTIDANVVNALRQVIALFADLNNVFNELKKVQTAVSNVQNQASVAKK